MLNDFKSLLLYRWRKRVFGNQQKAFYWRLAPRTQCTGQVTCSWMKFLLRFQDRWTICSQICLPRDKKIWSPSSKFIITRDYLTLYWKTDIATRQGSLCFNVLVEIKVIFGKKSATNASDDSSLQIKLGEAYLFHNIHLTGRDKEISERQKFTMFFQWTRIFIDEESACVSSRSKWLPFFLICTTI